MFAVPFRIYLKELCNSQDIETIILEDNTDNN